MLPTETVLRPLIIHIIRISRTIVMTFTSLCKMLHLDTLLNLFSLRVQVAASLFAWIVAVWRTWHMPHIPVALLHFFPVPNIDNYSRNSVVSVLGHPEWERDTITDIPSEPSDVGRLIGWGLLAYPFPQHDVQMSHEDFGAYLLLGEYKDVHLAIGHTNCLLPRLDPLSWYPPPFSQTGKSQQAGCFRRWCCLWHRDVILCHSPFTPLHLHLALQLLPTHLID